MQLTDCTEKLFHPSSRMSLPTLSHSLRQSKRNEGFSEESILQDPDGRRDLLAEIG